MGYLLVFLIVASGGILWLWVAQRRSRVRVDQVDSFTQSLQRISSRSIVGDLSEHREAARPAGGRRPEPLDPARREAARRRLEARRAVRT